MAERSIPYRKEDEIELEDVDLDLGWDAVDGDEVVRCVFSSEKNLKIGMGSSMTSRVNRVYWFVEQTGPDLFEARKINTHNVPSGDAEELSRSQLVESFSPQLKYYEDVVLPAMQELEGILDAGDEHRENGRLYSAEGEYGIALRIEERNVRALFGLGLVYAERKEVDRTRELLAELVQVKAAFDGKNQHLFNEFGISLRKAGLFAEAIAYYRRALDFVRNDEHLYYNLARAHYENDDWNGCLENLIMSNRLDPGLPLARNLFDVIIGLADDERLLQRYGKPPVPANVAMRARQILAAESGKVTIDESPVHLGPRGRARSGESLAIVDDEYIDLTLNQD